MRVIFLDIDGVLNNGVSRTVELPLVDGGTAAVPCFQPECVTRFNRLVRESRAHVVVSATWGRPFETEALRRYLREQEIECLLLGQTPVSHVWRPRGLDIVEWLESLTQTVESFCILDDHDDMMQLKRYLVQTEYTAGMQERHVHEALVLLMGDGHG
jgi:hypothetical protein